MAGTKSPWWRDVLVRTVRGIRAGVAAFFRPARTGSGSSGAPPVNPHQEKIREEETALTETLNENFPPANGRDSGAEMSADATHSQPAGGAAPAVANPAPEPSRAEVSETPAANLESAPSEPLPQAGATPQAVPREAENPPESPADLLAEAAAELDSAAGTDPQPASDEEPSRREQPVEANTAAEEVPENEIPAAELAISEPAISGPAIVEETAQEAASPAEPAAAEQAPSDSLPRDAASAAPEPPEAAAAAQAVVPPAHEPIKREQGPDTSPVSVVVSQVYEGPFDLLLDLIRKQDIDIYDIPIAKITAQFLAYVDRLKASDMDVAGEFIYTASLLIHIKSKMLLPREPREGGDAQEDPRRELVERLLEHERFKNAAQMLQQKQMLEAATWTNPGMREFQQGDEASDAGPEIAADTTDLVRVFRDILDRARNRPVFNLAEDSVTVGQMIQFLGRRLSMEDKPVALHRLLAHTKSERALIATFLALLELVRLQAILLRQDRHFSEIFIKKSSGFEEILNQGLARDDWQ